ncbi:MAG: VWA domain-containing protein [Acidobacteriota bacterium]
MDHHRTTSTVTAQPPSARDAALPLLGFGLLALLVAGMAPATAGAQEATATAATYGEVIDVEVVNVRVWVTDRDGNPVTGLRPSDFSVELDGEPAQITNLFEGRGGDTSEVPATVQLQTRPEAEIESVDAAGGGVGASSSSAVTTAASQQSRLIVYIDELHMGTLDRRRVIKDLREWLGDGGLDPESLLILQQLTDLRQVLPVGSSARDVDRALKKLRTAPTGVERSTGSKKLVVQRLWRLWDEGRQLTDRDPCQFFESNAEQEVVTYAQRASARARVSLSYLEEVSSFLAGLDGYKAVLYVGDTLETRPGQDLLELVQGLCPNSIDALPGDIASEEISTTFDQVAARANAGQVTLYTLQPSGLRVDSGYGVDQGTGDVRVNGAFDRALRQSSRDGLEQLAQQTGGEAYVNRNRFEKALDSMAEDLGTFYSLGITPPASRREGTMRLKVDVRGDRLSVRHRDSLELRSVRRRLFEQVMSAIHLGESQNPLQVRLASGTPRSAGEAVELPLIVRLPADSVTYLPTAEGELAELEVMVVARSPEYRGGSPVTRIYRTPRPADRDLLDLAMQLQLLPSGYVIGVGVWDRAAGQGSFVSTSIAVGPVGDS